MFDTETMAELCVKQGLTGEAVGDLPPPGRGDARRRQAARCTRRASARSRIPRRALRHHADGDARAARRTPRRRRARSNGACRPTSTQPGAADPGPAAHARRYRRRAAHGAARRRRKDGRRSAFRGCTRCASRRAGCATAASSRSCDRPARSPRDVEPRSHRQPARMTLGAPGGVI